MIIFFVIALIAFLLNAIFSILPCGIVSESCTEPFLALPSMVSEALSYFSSGIHYVLFLLGDGIGNAVLTSLTILLSVYLAQFVWSTLLYFKVPIISNVMNIFRANVPKE